MMRILVWGATPQAAWIAGRLHQTGHESIWLSNAAIKKDIETFGTLYLRSPQRHYQVRDLSIGTEIDQLLKPPLDWIILAMPIWEIGQAAIEMSRRIPPQHCPPILVIANGTGGLEKIENFFPETPIIQGFPTQHFTWPTLDDGTPAYENVVSDGAGGIALSANEKANDWPDLLRLIGFDEVQIHPLEVLQWSDLFWQIHANGIPVLLQQAVEALYEDEATFHLEYRQLREAIQVIDQLGVHLVDLPGVATRRLAWQVRVLPEKMLRPILAQNKKFPSLAWDIQQKTGRSDAAYLYGVVAKNAHDLGLHTPVSHILAIAVTDLAEGRALHSQFTVDYLETLVRVATPSRPRP